MKITSAKRRVAVAQGPRKRYYPPQASYFEASVMARAMRRN
jgi:hypothetical protein